MPKINFGKPINKGAATTTPTAAKPSSPAPKPKPKVKTAKGQPSSYEASVRQLANAADQAAMRAQDLLRFPELLSTRGISPDAVTRGMAHDADKLNRQLINELLAPFKK